MTVNVTQQTQPGEKLLRLPQVLERLPISSAAWWRGVKDGRYPQAVKLAPRVTVWRQSDIDQLIRSL